MRVYVYDDARPLRPHEFTASTRAAGVALAKQELARLNLSRAAVWFKRPNKSQGAVQVTRRPDGSFGEYTHGY